MTARAEDQEADPWNSSRFLLTSCLRAPTAQAGCPPGGRNTGVDTARARAAPGMSVAKSKAGSCSVTRDSPASWLWTHGGLAHLLCDRHCPGHWFLLFRNSASEAYRVGYVSTPKTVLCGFEILSPQLNNSVLRGRIESQLGNVCCQD